MTLVRINEIFIRVFGALSVGDWPSLDSFVVVGRLEGVESAGITLINRIKFDNFRGVYAGRWHMHILVSVIYKVINV